MHNVVYLDHKADEIYNFKIDRTGYGNMDDWLPVEHIEKVKTT